jgi:hypothetical protein
MLIRPLDEQVRILREVLPEAAMPDLTFPTRCEVPEGADGWFATLSYHYGLRPAKFLQLVVGRIGERLGLRNEVGDLLDPNRYGYGGFGGLHHAMTRKMQGSPDIMLFPGQFGRRHQERCVRDIARMLKKDDEFLLGVPDVLCMLLTHPERLREVGTAVVCGGDLVQGRAGEPLVPVLSRAYDGALLLTSIRRTDTATVLSTPSGFVPLYAEQTVDA